MLSCQSTSTASRIPLTSWKKEQSSQRRKEYPSQKSWTGASHLTWTISNSKFVPNFSSSSSFYSLSIPNLTSPGNEHLRHRPQLHPHRPRPIRNRSLLKQTIQLRIPPNSPRWNHHASGKHEAWELWRKRRCDGWCPGSWDENAGLEVRAGVWIAEFLFP